MYSIDCIYIMIIQRFFTSRHDRFDGNVRDIHSIHLPNSDPCDPDKYGTPWFIYICRSRIGYIQWKMILLVERNMSRESDVSDGRNMVPIREVNVTIFCIMHHTITSRCYRPYRIKWFDYLNVNNISTM